MRKLVLLGSMLLIVGLTAATVFWESYLSFLGRPASSGDTIVKVDLREGISHSELADLLFKEGLVSNRTWFSAYLDYFRKNLNIKPGEYAFSAASSPVEILDVLEKGQTVTYSLVIDPKMRASEVAEQIALLGLADRAEIQMLMESHELAQELHLSAPGLEGFLYPDAYELPKGLTPRELLTKLVERYKKNRSEEVLEAGRLRGLSELQLVTLASIIQIDSPRQDELAQYAAIYHNRLKRGMNLESKAALAYGLKKKIHELSKEDFKSDSPYNTYKRGGLPPTPIANPAQRAVVAAANPAAVDFLYVRPNRAGSRFCVTEDCGENVPHPPPRKKRKVIVEP